MKDNHIENAAVTADPAAAEEKNAATELGKFKDVQALLQAYSALEAEFTRRSQRLKELEANKGNTPPAAIDAANGQTPSQARSECSPPPDTPAEGRAASTQINKEPTFKEVEKLANIAAVEGARPEGEGAESGAGKIPSDITDEIKNAVIAEYLNGVRKGRSVAFVTGGGAVTAARRTPSDVREAGALAKNFFDGKEKK